MNDLKKHIKIIEDDKVDLKKLFQLYIVNRSFIYGFCFFATLIGLIIYFLITPLYKSEISVYQKNKENSNDLALIAQSFGYQGLKHEKVYNLVDLVESKRFKDSILNKQWMYNGRTVNLMKLWGFKVDSNKNKQDKILDIAESRIEAYEKLDERIMTSEKPSGLINI